jgi:hypothetical protein
MNDFIFHGYQDFSLRRLYELIRYGLKLRAYATVQYFGHCSVHTL